MPVKPLFRLYKRSSSLYLSKLRSIQSLNSKCSKQKGENLGERMFGEKHKLAVGPTTAVSKGGQGELKADSVLDNWDNYKFSEYSFS